MEKKYQDAVDEVAALYLHQFMKRTDITEPDESKVAASHVYIGVCMERSKHLWYPYKDDIIRYLKESYGRERFRISLTGKTPIAQRPSAEEKERTDLVVSYSDELAQTVRNVINTLILNHGWSKAPVLYLEEDIGTQKAGSAPVIGAISKYEVFGNIHHAFQFHLCIYSMSVRKIRILLQDDTALVFKVITHNWRGRQAKPDTMCLSSIYLAGRSPSTLLDGRVVYEITKVSPETKEPKCMTCGKTKPKLKKCAKCRKVFYCSAECQRQNWKSHRALCGDGK